MSLKNVCAFIVFLGFAYVPVGHLCFSYCGTAITEAAGSLAT